MSKSYLFKFYAIIFFMKDNFDLAELIRQNPVFSLSRKMKFAVALSIPGILSQISSIVMQYIDAAMVGHLGANASAAIGLSAPPTWVLGSLSNALCIGFTVQAAHAVGSGSKEQAKMIFFKAIRTCLLFSVILAALSAFTANQLPLWLGAGNEIRHEAAVYFLIFGLSTPLYMMITLMGGMLQCSGNMKIPGILNTLLCLSDALFNVIFIRFLNMGVKGAALGSSASALLIAAIFIYFSAIKSETLSLLKFRPLADSGCITGKALRLALPVAVEQVAFTGALVAVTKIIAPLGAAALSANSFAVTAEALCYMPAYGIQGAATTLTGQSTGAGRKDLVKSFSILTILLGMSVTAITGIIMYFICPFVFRMLTPDPEIQVLSIKVLRIELFAEPFFGASIICNGILRGKGDTFVPSILNLVSLWIVRLGLSLLLVSRFQLPGIWFAMAAELTFRGIILPLRVFCPGFFTYSYSRDNID